LPVTRKLGEAVFSGSIIRRDEIGGLVYATGANTYFGKTAQLVQEAHTVSHFQRAENNDTIDLAVLGGLENDQGLKGYQVHVGYYLLNFRGLYELYHAFKARLPWRSLLVYWSKEHPIFYTLFC